jgi:hypothetical protein
MIELPKITIGYDFIIFLSIIFLAVTHIACYRTGHSTGYKQGKDAQRMCGTNSEREFYDKFNKG